MFGLLNDLNIFKQYAQPGNSLKESTIDPYIPDSNPRKVCPRLYRFCVLHMLQLSVVCILFGVAICNHYILIPNNSSLRDAELCVAPCSHVHPVPAQTTRPPTGNQTWQ